MPESPWRSDRTPTHLSRGVVASVVGHAALLFPLILAAFIWGGEEEARRADEVDVSFKAADPDTLPEDLPPLEDVVAPADKKKAAEKAKKTTLAAEAAPKPEREIVAPRPEELKELPKIEQPKPDEPAPPPPAPPKLHEKVVDLDTDKDEKEPPADAKYLSQKNNRVAEETRATETNLERELKGKGKASSKSDNKDTEVGGEEARIAQTDDQKSRLGREAPKATPHDRPSLGAGAEHKQSLLTMRELEQKRHEITPETVDRSLPRDPNGDRSLPEANLKSVKDLVGRAGEEPNARLRLTGDQLRYVVGDDAEAAVKFAQQQKSQKKGRYAEKMGKIQSALENFIPEVRPGNQTALNTRAAPFAVFIARMHRNIHQLWGFGFLEDVDSKSSSSQYNNPELMTQVEIVMNGDGTIDNVKVIRPSGFTPFDVAAVDAVLSAGPYPEPPKAIRSGNGKIYVHWKLHRDGRQCATSGADYFILNNAPAGGAEDGSEPARGLPGDERRPQAGGPKRLERGIPDSPQARAKMRELNQAAGIPEPDQQAARQVSREIVRADDPGARAVADRFFEGYVRGDVVAMSRQASFPFRSSAGVAAKTGAELQAILRELISETSGQRRLGGRQLYSAAGLRGGMGGVPPGFGDGDGKLFAVGTVAGTVFVLVLERVEGAWRAVGLVRR